MTAARTRCPRTRTRRSLARLAIRVSVRRLRRGDRILAIDTDPSPDLSRALPDEVKRISRSGDEILLATKAIPSLHNIDPEAYAWRLPK